MKRRALISVSDKKKVVDFASELVTLDFEIISTGGTAELLSNNGIAVTLVSKITGFPEIMNGRVKTLNPKIHGGILARRDNDTHLQQAEEQEIQMIDLVVVNLYPFEEVMKKEDATLDELIENIDIGGPSMIRAAAKNNEFVTVVVDSNDFDNIITEYKTNGDTSKELRFELAVKAYKHTANYDTMIANKLREQLSVETADYLQVSAPLATELRYGENPHQKAGYYNVYQELIEVIHGKQPSYNNYMDTDAALRTIIRFDKPAAAILKHTNPCGIATGDTITEAYTKAFATDTASPYGGIVVVNRQIDMEFVNKINEIFTEIIIAPSYTEEALAKLRKRKDRRLITYNTEKVQGWAHQSVVLSCLGGYLEQDNDVFKDNPATWRVVTEKRPTVEQMDGLAFAWNVVSILKSNAIAITNREQTLGLGIGQTSRVDSAEIAINRAKRYKHIIKDAVCASDGFFPFKDSVELLNSEGISAIIQPGGSKTDQEVIDACNEYGIAMVFTDMRHFRH